jgi:putative hydrolase of the HAD superfamily
MSEIQVIYFDLGKVLLNFEWEPILSRLSTFWKGTKADIIGFISEDDLLHKFERGEISQEDFLHYLMDKTSFQGDIDSMAHIWSDIFNPMEDNIKLAHELSAHYPLGLISNINETHFEFVESRYDFLGIFTSKTYSHLVGSRKPEMDIYKCALDSFGIQAENALFIDDMLINIEAARSLGMHAVHFTETTDLRSELSIFKVKI